MTTHTIVLIGDMLMATAPDGNDALLAERLEDSLSQMNAEDRDEARTQLRYESGLTLYQEVSDADEDGAEIIYSGTGMGWLEDEDGSDTVYQAAARK